MPTILNDYPSVWACSIQKLVLHLKKFFLILNYSLCTLEVDLPNTKTESAIGLIYLLEQFNKYLMMKQLIQCTWIWAFYIVFLFLQNAKGC